MTARELIAGAAGYPALLMALFGVAPALALVLRLVTGPQQREAGLGNALRYAYAVLIYLACVPGVLAAVLTGYVLFFTRQNLLDVNLLIYGLPIASMVVTLLLISRSVTFDEIPGFGRLSGLMVMIAATFVILLALHRTRLWLVFGGSIYTLGALAVGVFGLLKWGAYAAFRRRDEPERDPPSFP